MVLRGGAGLFFDRPSGNSIYSQVQNPPTYTSVTVRNAQLQTLANAGLTIAGAPALNVFEYAGNLPSSTQWNGGIQMALPWSSALDVEYVGQHSFNTLDGVDINAIDFGAAFLPQNQDLTLQPNATPGAMAVAQDQMRAFRGYAGITQQWGRGWRTFHSLQLSFNRRFKDGLSFGFNDTIVLADNQSTGARLQHNADGTYALRSDQAEADELLGTVIANRHLFKGNFVWDMPDIRSGGAALKALGVIVNDWQVSGVWTGATGSAYTVGFSYQNGGGNVNLTGSPSYGARIRVMGDPGSGCSSNVYQQFNTVRVPGPADQQRRPRVGRRLSAGMFHERAGSLHRPQYPFGRRPQPSVAGRPVQRAQLSDHHGTQHDDQPVEPERPRDGDESSLRRERQLDRVALPAAHGGVRRGQRVPGRSERAGPDSVLVLIDIPGGPRSTDLPGPVEAPQAARRAAEYFQWQTSPDGISSSALSSPASSRGPGLAACRRSRRWAINHPTRR